MSAYVPPVGARVRVRTSDGGFLPGTYTVRSVVPIVLGGAGDEVVYLHGFPHWVTPDCLSPADMPDRPGDLSRFIARLFPPDWPDAWARVGLAP